MRNPSPKNIRDQIDILKSTVFWGGDLNIPPPFPPNQCLPERFAVPSFYEKMT